MPAKLKPVMIRITAQTPGFTITATTRTAADASADIAPNTRTCPTLFRSLGTVNDPQNMPRK